MRKLLRKILYVIAFVAYAIGIQAQSVELQSKAASGEIEGLEENTRTTVLRDDPMVIGPDLYNQMGTIGGYYGLSVGYTEAKFEEYIGQSADDFIVPAGGWELKYVRASMYTPSTLDSVPFFNVYIYSDNGGKPGDIAFEIAENSDVHYQYNPTNSGLVEATVTLNENIDLLEGTYWISIVPYSVGIGENSYGDPGFWMGHVLQGAGDPIYSEGNIQNPGGGYFPITSWTPMSQYWEYMQGTDYGFYNFSFALFGPEKSKDLAVTELVSPTTDAGISDAEIVEVVIQNHGTDNVADGDYDVRYRIDGGDWYTDAAEGKAVNSGEEITYELRTKADLSAKGVYAIEVELVYSADENEDNDIIITEVENYGTIYPAVVNELVTYTTCEGTFTDHGGLGNVVVGYSHDTVVFMPGTPNSRIRLEFYNTGMGGAYPFRFYNGSDTDAPELGNWEALNSSEGIYTQEIHGLVLEGANAEGAITIIIPGFDVVASTNNFLASVSCVPNVDVDFLVEDILPSKPYSWETETIELIASIQNRSLVQKDQMVTFFVDDVELGSVSSTIMEFGEAGTATMEWTPATAGVYSIRAKVPTDDGQLTEEKEYTIEHEIFEMGALVEGFEGNQYPPEGWETRVPGGSSRYFVWYNDRDYWEGKWKVSLNSDTIITPKLDIKEGDVLKFTYSAGFFGGTCDIIYAESLDGPWEVAHTVDYGLPWAIEYEATLKNAIGAHYIGFKASGGSIDYIRGPKLFFNTNDLAIAEVDGSVDPQINVETSYSVKVRNMGTGTLAGADYTVKLWKNIDGVETELASLNGVDIALANYHAFEFTHTFTNVEIGNVYITVDYSADEDLINNTSRNIALNVIKEGVEYVYDGDVNTEGLSMYALPGYYGSYSEIIYHKDSLNAKGELSGISFYYESFTEFDYNFRVFIGETELDNVEAGYLSTSKLDKVFDGVLHADFTNSNYFQVYIEFDEPYLYSGDKNLVVAFNRHQTEDGYYDFSSRLSLKGTPVEANILIAAGFQSYEMDTDLSDVAELDGLNSSIRNERPNMMFYVKTTDMDNSLVGTVTDEADANLEGVELALDGFANTTLTDVDGKYSFPVMPITTLDITASFYGYFDSTKVAAITAGNEIIVDFKLIELPEVIVTGTVLANDSLKPVSGVEITLTGYEQEVIVSSGADGKFTIPGVLGDKEYDISFGHFMYDTVFVTEFVSIYGLDLGDVVLDEIEQAGFNVIAKSSGDDMEITWQAPYSGIEDQLKPMGDAEIDLYLYNEPDEDVQLGNLFRVENPGTVTSVDIHVFGGDWAEDGDLTFKIYNKERELVVESNPFTMPREYGWFTFDVPDFTYTDEFYIMLHWNKLHQQTSGLSFHGMPDDNVAYIIQGNGDFYLIPDLYPTLPQYSGAHSIIANVIEEGSKTTRAVTSYDLYRSDLADSQDETAKTKITDTPVIASGNSFSFVDETYSEVANGYYIYTLETHYTLADAPYVLSNDVSKGLFSSVVVNVTANNGENIDGAVIELVNKNDASINHYIASVQDSVAIFPSVLKGEYWLKGKKGAAYEKYSETVTIDADPTFDVELIEVIFSPDNLSVVPMEDEGVAIFTWAVGESKEYRYDDGSFEQPLGIKIDGSAALGNIFTEDEGGDVISMEIYGWKDTQNNPDDEMGEVIMVFYDVATEALLGKSDPFSILGDEWFTVGINNVKFNGPFYALVQWSELEDKQTHVLGIDTDEDPGHTYYYDEELGFVEMASAWGMYGNFGIRANVLVNGKKSTYTAGSKPVVENIEVSSKLNTFEVAKAVIAPSRSAHSFNIYLDDMTTPIDTVTSQTFVFNEANHLTVPGLHTYTAGVQSVYVTGKSSVIPLDFEYDNVVSVIDMIDSELVMYPNPATSSITITNIDNGSVELYNTLGKLVKAATINAGNNSINVANLTGGTYVVRIKLAEGIIYRNLVITE